jgi:hypothetical protein
MYNRKNKYDLNPFLLTLDYWVIKERRRAVLQNRIIKIV